MKWEVINADCLEAMKGIPDGSVDAVITDPPYGLEFRGHAWDRNIPVWLEEARRVAKLVIFTTAPTTMWDYPRPDWVNCWYREASNSRTATGGFNHWSPVLVYGNVKFPVDSLKLHAIQHATSKDIDHPSPKPLALISWLIENVTVEGESILDPFCGSGTVGLACALMGRNFTGIEIDEQYCELSRTRIRRAQGEACDIPRRIRVEKELPLLDVLPSLAVNDRLSIDGVNVE